MSKRYPGNFITGNPVALSQTSNSGIWDLKDQYQATANGTWQENDGVYEIPKSLRFRNSASAYLARTFSAPTNNLKWTWSCWFKRGFITTDTVLFSQCPGSNLYMELRLAGDGSFQWTQLSSGPAVTARKITTRLLRDPSAWYHLVCVWDTANSIASNRMLVYINGEQITSFSTSVDPSSSLASFINTATLHDIGDQFYNASARNGLYDGYLAEVNFIDGQALDASYFGYTDSTTNIWQPKKYTGAYGTNGFYLPFTDNSTTASLNNTGIGKDFSGNGNYWTPNNISLARGTYTSYTTGSGTYTVPANVTSINYLVIAGGGGGGNGGGGAGGTIFSTMSVTPGQTIAYSVGGGGAGATIVSGTGPKGTNGTNSTFGDVTAIGGGGGGSQSGAYDGAAGGSGGGAGATYSTINYGGAGTSGQGNAGGNGRTGAIDYITGGGGGAGGVGGSGSGNTSGTGGAGLTWINGSIYAGGGGGGARTPQGSSPGAGGSGGGDGSGTGNGGAANGYGGGGGGAAMGGGGNVNTMTGGAGGGGIIIVGYGSTSTHDSSTDSPTNVFTSTTDFGGVVAGNYCTFSPIDIDASITLSNGNLTASTGNTGVHNNGRMTMGTGTSGFWYMEFTYVNTISGGTALAMGLYDPAFRIENGTHPVSSASGFYGLYGSSTSNMYTNGSTGASVSVSTGSAGDTLQLAYDVAGGKLWYGLNNAWYDSSGGTTGNPSTGANPTITTVATNRVFGYDLVYNTFNVNFGQRPFTYAPPTGYKSLNTTNIQALGTAAIGSAAITPNKWMDASLWGGTGVDVKVTNSGFQPDLVWNKSRSVTENHLLTDSVRGVGMALYSNLTNAEGYDPGVNKFNTDGFTSYGSNGYSYVSWQWKQSPTSGFNIVPYTGTGANQTITHNLGVIPSMIIAKNRTGSVSDWGVWHTSMGDNFLRLNTTTAAASSTPNGVFNVSSITSSVIAVGASSLANQTSASMIAYLWAEVPGFSKFGSYTGNGATDGTFVYTGFRPRLIMLKRTDSIGNWTIYDSTRNPYNAGSYPLYPNLNNVEDASVDHFDWLSNGFKMRSTNQNTSGGTFIYAAFAESPFGLNNRAR